MLYLGILLQTVIHESGHLVFGLLSGYKFSSFRILSLCFTKSENKIKIKKFSIPGTLGQCLMLPPQEKLNGLIPYKLYNVGGCAFNLIFSLLFLTLAFIFSSSALIVSMCQTFAITGFILFINNGIPMRTPFIQNDGQNVIDISKSEQANRSFAIQLLVSESQTRGIKISDMPEEWFIYPNQYELDNPIVSTQVYLICSRLIERGDFYNAHLQIRNLLNNATNLLGIYKLLLELELIYLDAIHGWDFNQQIINRLNELEKNLKVLKNNPSTQRVLYTVEIVCKGNEKQAQKHLERFEKLAKKYPFAQEIESERKLIALATEKANELKTQASKP